MLRILIRKELLASLLTMRLVVALVFTVVLCLLTTLMGSLDFSSNAEEYRGVLADNASGPQTTVYQHVYVTVFCAPQPLHILSRGMVEGRGLWGWFNAGEYRRGLARFGSGYMDDLLAVLVRADFTSVVGLVLTFLAVVLGFDCICGEREQGTLRLLLSHSVTRAQVVTAKLAGGVISLLIPLAVAYCGSLLILLANPDVVLSGDDWMRLLLLFVLSALLLSLVFSLSAMVSACVRSPATSLIVCLFGWLVAGIGYVNALPAIARYALPYPPYEEFVSQAEEVRAEFEREMAAWDAQNPAPDPAYRVWQDRGGVIRYGHRTGYVWLAGRTAFEFERRLDRADRIYDLRWQNQGPLAEQEFAVDRWSILSPITNYRTLSKLLVGSSLDDYFFAADYGVEYRRTYVQWLRARMHAVGWERWFTDDPAGQEPMVPDPAAADEAMLAEDSEFMQARRQWAEAQEQRLAPTRPNLDLAALPKPGPGWRRDLGQALLEMGPGLLVLVLMFVLSLLVTVRRFLRYDVS